jgi:TonB family protein
MPLNVRKYVTSVLGVLTLTAGSIGVVSAQTSPVGAPVLTNAPVMGPPTSGDIMRDRISKSKAYIAVRNFGAAIYELENIRKESGDQAVQGVVNILLMNSYLEQGDFKRAQNLLNEFHAAQKTTKPNAAVNYMAIAGQVVKSARTRAERYKALGLSISDRALPQEAVNDLNKMRETLELVITQAKENGGDKAKTSDAMAMLEEASNSRALLARDDYDSRRWKNEVADTRESMASSRSVVTSAMGEPDSTLLASATPKPLAQPPVSVPVSKPVIVPAAQTTATPESNLSGATRDREVRNAPPPSAQPEIQNPVYVPEPVKTAPVQTPNTQAIADNKETAKPAEQPKPAPPIAEPAKTDAVAAQAAVNDSSPLNVGSLVGYATEQAKPVYPPAAKAIRTTGIVKVDVAIDENGQVEVQKLSGPMMLQAAAKDAIRKWKFKPFVRDGQPVKATGFVNFNFAL